MKKSLIVLASSFLLIAAAACSMAAAGETPADPTRPAPLPGAVAKEIPAENGLDGWELVWQDEFDGERLDRSNWTFDLSGGGWGNDELQYYTDRPENVRLEDGLLVIEAIKEEYRGSSYTSGRIKTQGLQEWTYGRFEARMKLPVGKGTWSAFWLLGANIDSALWPLSGEIDIMENIGDPDAIGGAVHGPGYFAGENIGTTFVSSNLNVDEDFHVYAVEWYPEEITWFVDDIVYHQVSIDEVPGDWVFDHPFFMILNLAIGGKYPGNPDETTVFPMQVQVDYVRVYKDPALVITAKPELHVSDIRFELEQAGENMEASALVVIVDQNGSPVGDVEVEAGWLGVVAGADSNAVTDAAGVAGPFRALKSVSADEISFCVTKVTHLAFEYNKSENIQTCMFVDTGSP